MIKRILFFTIAFSLGFSAVVAQELNATVRVTAPRLQTVDPQVFKTMEAAIIDFMNNNKWSPDEWQNEERIECAFQINILNELSDNAFTADIAFQALRPVYMSDYKTPLVSWVDKNVVITYEQFQPIQVDRDIFNDNLSSVLTYYAYLILGYDYDSFSEQGGDPYFRIAQNIVNNIPPGVRDLDNGWSTIANNRNNRFWIVENLLSPKMTEYRKAIYRYHRLSLDLMATEPAKGQSEMLAALNQVDQARSTYPNTMVLRMFAVTKSDEIIEVFKAADRTSKSRVMQIMRKLDGANANKYDVLRS